MVESGKYLLAALAVAMAGPALAQDTIIDNWVMTDEGDFCATETVHQNPDGSVSVLRVELDFMGKAFLGVSRSDWVYSGERGSAEIWLGQDWNRPADLSGDVIGEGNALWMNVGDPFVESMAGQQWLVLRVTGGGIDRFQSFFLGTTANAIDKVFECADYLW